MCNALSDLNHNKSFQNMEDLPLSDYSKSDDVWNEKREATELLGSHLLHFSEFKKWGEKALVCANILAFGFVINKETGEIKIKLNQANFCRLRHCPVCNWRRSLRLQASFYNFLPEFMDKNPKARWVFLTLTAPNVKIENLGDQLTKMNQAWQRLTQRKALGFINGFIRTTEVTREKKRRNYAHPHFHCLLQVDPDYFRGSKYLSQAKWLEIWRECMRDDSITQVNVKAIKGDISADKVLLEVTKTFNYSIEIDEYKKPDEWLLEYFRQVHRRRFIVAGGNLKNAIKDMRESDEENENLINVDEEKDDKEPLKEDEKLYFGWRNKEFIYRKTNPFKKD